MRKVHNIDFELTVTNLGECLRFSQGTNKNWKADVRRCAPRQMRPLVDVFCTNVISTYRILMPHCPWKLDEPGPHPMFLSPRIVLKD